MKKWLLGIAVMLALLSLAACSQGQTGPASGAAEEIVLYNWTDYMNPEVLEMFTEETGIKVVEDYFSSNEELIAKLEGGATGYALIIPTDYAAQVMIEQGLLATLDKTNIPNFSNLSPEFQSTIFDPEDAHCIPYQWGMTGIAYLDGALETPTSWSSLFNAAQDSPQYNRMMLLDDPREAFAAALLYLGYDVNTTDMAQLEEAKALLIRAKAGISSYDNDTFDEMLLAEEIILTHAWNGEVLASKEENARIEFLIPEEGGVVYMEMMCIPATATPAQKEAAETLINFLLRGDIGAMLSEYIYYGTPNAAATEFLSEDYLSNPFIFPPAEQRQKLQAIMPLGEFDAVYQRLWDEVKAAP